MSLTRLMLRLVTIEALRPYAALGAGGPFPTALGAAVFDTRLDPIDDLAADERRPEAVVFTEEHNGDPIAQGNSTLKFTVTLVVEFSLTALGDDPDNPGVMVPGIPFTDAELEANLDLIEAQIRAALRASMAWSAIVQKIIDWDSLPHRSSEEGRRLAMRTLRMKVQIADDCVIAAPAVPLVGLNRLPPSLRALADGLNPASAGYKILTGIAPAVPNGPVAVPLKGATLNLDVADPNGAVTGTPNIVAAANNLDL